MKKETGQKWQTFIPTVQHGGDGVTVWGLVAALAKKHGDTHDIYRWFLVSEQIHKHLISIALHWNFIMQEDYFILNKKG